MFILLFGRVGAMLNFYSIVKKKDFIKASAQHNKILEQNNACFGFGGSDQNYIYQNKS